MGGAAGWRSRLRNPALPWLMAVVAVQEVAAAAVQEEIVGGGRRGIHLPSAGPSLHTRGGPSSTANLCAHRQRPRRQVRVV
jgi:hypothetical protein